MKTRTKVGLTIIGLLLLNACAQKEKTLSDEISLEDIENYTAQNAQTTELSEWENEQEESLESTTDFDEVSLEDRINNGIVAADANTYNVANVNNTGSNYSWTSNIASNKQSIQQNKESILSSKGISNPYKDKQFIKQADIRFQVENVYKSTVAIENILQENDGFLINSNIQSELLGEQIFEKDKTWNTRVQKYVNTNHLTIRVPNENMHNTLLALGSEIVFLNHRSINADDVGLKLLAESLEQKRNAKFKTAIQKNISEGGKLNDKIYAQEVAFDRQKTQDISRINQLKIEDKITYSTITIEIYEDAKVFVSDIPNLTAYKDSFKKSYGKELLDSLQIGIDVLKVILKILAALVPIVLLILGGFLLYRKWKKHK